MKPSTFFGFLGIASAISCLTTACSPYVYNQEITDFTKGVDSVDSAFENGQQVVATIVTQQQQATEINSRTRLDILPGCDSVDPKGQVNPKGTLPEFDDCAVVPFGASAVVSPTPAQVALKNAAPTFAALKGYAAALAAVTNASDDASLTQAATDLTSAATGLTDAVANVAPQASNENAVITAAGGVVGQVFVRSLDYRRLATLRADVPSVDSSIKTLGDTVISALLVIRAQELAQMQKELHSDVAPFQDAAVAKMKASDYQNGLSALQAGVASFNQTRAVDPATAVHTMINAHHQLAQALLSDAGQSRAVYAAAESFYTAASQLQSALNQKAPATD